MIKYAYYVEAISLPYGNQGAAGPLPADHRIHSVFKTYYIPGGGVQLTVLVEAPMPSLSDIETRTTDNLTTDYPER